MMGRYKSIYTLKHEGYLYQTPVPEQLQHLVMYCIQPHHNASRIMEASTVTNRSHCRLVPLAHVSLDLVGLSKSRPHHFAF